MINKSGKTVSKTNLPIKYCLVCKREFKWRKKWQKDWEQVKYCSLKCKKIAKN